MCETFDCHSVFLVWFYCIVVNEGVGLKRFLWDIKVIGPFFPQLVKISWREIRLGGRLPSRTTQKLRCVGSLVGAMACLKELLGWVLDKNESCSRSVLDLSAARIKPFYLLLIILLKCARMVIEYLQQISVLFDCLYFNGQLNIIFFYIA